MGNDIDGAPGRLAVSNDKAYQGAASSASGLSDFASLSFLIEQALAQISTGTLVVVKTAPYDASGNPITPGTAGPIGFVNVQPLVNQLDGYGNATPHGIIYKLCYLRYQGGNGAFITDPAVNDIGWMSVADRDTSSVRATGKQANPGSRRKFDKADGVFIGCLIAGTPAQYFSFTTTGFRCVDKSANTFVGQSDGIVVNGVRFDRNGNVYAPGEIYRGYGTGDQVSLGAHTHNQGVDSRGDTEQPTNAPNAGT